MIDLNFFTVGLSFDCCSSVFVPQMNSMLCWAASTEMVLKSHCINDINQNYILNYFFKNTNDFDSCYPNCPYQLKEVANFLNNQLIRDGYNHGKRITAIANIGLPNADALIDDINKGNPIIISYRPNGEPLGHAVVVTNVEYQYWIDGVNRINKLFILDPDNNPINKYCFGRKVYEGKFLSEMITDYLVIHVQDEFILEVAWK